MRLSMSSDAEVRQTVQHILHTLLHRHHNAHYLAKPTSLSGSFIVCLVCQDSLRASLLQPQASCRTGRSQEQRCNGGCKARKQQQQQQQQQEQAGAAGDPGREDLHL
ncbi:hypothetical protein O3P69_019188 [Scylla paramamosain]|uniref:Uncharacterized protein n=1 Tax=Scylla paramamosain TaxID=85552 RepID=A0AAW0SV61_SCYPA